MKTISFDWRPTISEFMANIAITRERKERKKQFLYKHKHSLCVLCLSVSLVCWYANNNFSHSHSSTLCLTLCPIPFVPKNETIAISIDYDPVSKWNMLWNLEKQTILSLSSLLWTVCFCDYCFCFVSPFFCSLMLVIVLVNVHYTRNDTKWAIVSCAVAAVVFVVAVVAVVKWVRQQYYDAFEQYIRISLLFFLLVQFDNIHCCSHNIGLPF